MSLQGIYDAARQGDWQDENPSKCGCGGRGWFLSDVDTWHPCSLHQHGAPHPEEETDDSDFDWKALIRRNFVDAFRTFRKAARATGWQGSDFDFELECGKELRSLGVITATPSNWVDAAETIFRRAEYEVNERRDQAERDRQDAEMAAAEKLAIQHLCEEHDEMMANREHPLI